jgi:hypothetical protein
MGEFRTPGYDGPEGTEWPRPKRKDEPMAQREPELPADLEGTVITVASCNEHGAHIKVLAYVGGKPISVQQMTPRAGARGGQRPHAGGRIRRGRDCPSPCPPQLSGRKVAGRHVRPDATAGDAATKTEGTGGNTTASDTATTEPEIIRSNLPYAGFVHSKEKRHG